MPFLFPGHTRTKGGSSAWTEVMVCAHVLYLGLGISVRFELAEKDWIIGHIHDKNNLPFQLYHDENIYEFIVAEIRRWSHEMIIRSLI